MSNERVEMTIKMQVTPAQGLALQSMFEHWNKMSSWGCSRAISFYVDGDGNFHPKAEVTFSEDIPELTDEMREKSAFDEKGSGDVLFDFDPIAWILHNDKG
jgi:hypothetical protein